MNSLKDLNRFQDKLPSREGQMPVLFVGHGSPMNGIEDNEFSAAWMALGKSLDPPAAVLCISAHWLTNGTWVTAMEKPPTIHDFYGFPQALFQVNYPAPGDPALAATTASLVKQTTVGLDHEWGLDHGTWSVVRRMYPDATIPVLQLSIDHTQPAQYHYALAEELSALRQKGILIIGSGNMVHNLRMIDWKKPDSGFDWATETNETFKSLISSGNYQSMVNYEQLGEGARLSIPTNEHYLPLIYALGLRDKHESIEFFNDKMTMGSISMTSIKIA